jgi:hypothetical protein
MAQKESESPSAIQEVKAFNLAPDFIGLLTERCAEALSQANWTPYGMELEAFQQKYISSLSGYMHHIPALVEATFWASLEKVEGRTHCLSLMFVPDNLNSNSFIFRKPIRLESKHLAMLAPAVEGSAPIGVWPEINNDLCIWGFTPSPWPWNLAEEAFLPHAPFTIKVLESGQLVTSFLGVRSHVTGSKARFIKPHTLQDFISAELYRVGRIANIMRSHRHGGTLLVVPNDTSSVKSVDFQKLAAHSYEKTKIALKSWVDIRDQYTYEAFEIARRPLQLIGQLTAVDGATVITRDFTVLGFGVKIKTKANKLRVLVLEPFEGSEKIECDISDLGGTRHQSAARFVAQHKDSIAIVASQDGMLSIFEWMPNEGEEGMVAVTRPAELIFADRY